MSRTQQIIVIDHGASNLRSVVRTLARIGVALNITNDTRAIREAPTVVFTGVGSTADTMRSLHQLSIDLTIHDSIQCGVEATVIGRALYTGDLNLSDALVARYHASLTRHAPCFDKSR